MRILDQDIPFNPLALADAVERQPFHTMIPDARFMPPPMNHEYAMLRYRCAHLNYALKKIVLANLEWLCGVKGDE